MLTLQDLAGQTGLTENSIRKYLRLFGSFLKPYIKRGVANKLLFDPNCVVIFNEVRTLRNEGKIAKEIIASLVKQSSSSQEIIYQPIDNEPSCDVGQFEDYRQNIQGLYHRLLAEKEKRIQERDEHDVKIIRLEIENVKMHDAIKLLPGGMQPAQVRREWKLMQEKWRAAEAIVADLSKLSFFSFRKRKKYLEKLQACLAD